MIVGRVTSGLALGMLSFWLIGCATSPPVQEMSDARQAIAAAEEADADRLAPQTIGEARDYLAQAEEQIRDRNYGLARGSAMRARTRAIYALQASQAAQEAEEPPEATNN